MTVTALLNDEVVWSDTFIAAGADDELLIKASKFESLTQGQLTLDQINSAVWEVRRA